MNDITIDVKNISKIYKLYDKPIDRIKETFNSGKGYHKDFMAVNDVSFQVKKGETVGIIGGNGAGKSTLLKMITGVLTPSSGSISLSGKVSALLELGTGFDAEKNGIENIYLNGRINKLSRQEIDASVNSILDFADIGEFIYQPIKTYSSGMLVRLAFATAVNINPEILIVDEALSVGDVRFQQKCYRKIREFKNNGTVLFVSHDTGAISSFCDWVIWMDKGEIYKIGEPMEIIEEYLAYMRYEIKKELLGNNFDSKADTPEDDNNTYTLEFGNEAAYFSKIALMDQQNHVLPSVKPGQDIQIYLELKTNRTIESPILGFNIKDSLGNELIVTNNIFERTSLPPLLKNQLYRFGWKFKFPCLHSGEYPVDISLAEGTYQVHEQIHFITDALIIKCLDDRFYQEGRGRYVPDDIELAEIK